MKSLAVVALTVGLVACGPGPRDSSQSEYAYFQAETAYGGPLGRLEALRQGFQTDFSRLDICVETGKDKIADDEVIFETRLAYAAWLSGSGLYSEADWQKFHFVGQPFCDRQDKTLAGFISILSAGNTSSADGLDAYQAQQIQCTTNGSWKNCQGSGVTLGWGGPGGLAAWYLNSSPKQWTKLALGRASSTTLSPYIDWLPLTVDINGSKLLDAQKQQLLTSYAALKANVEPTMAQLSGFLTQLEALQLVAIDDPVFSSLATQFYSANAATVSKTYRGQFTAFATILHEVGHQFGMDHAHHPGQDSTTGKSAKSTVDSQGKNVTDFASMAYGLRYNYLTDDDKLGIQADAANVRQFLTTHK